MRIVSGAATDTGRVREGNEDSYLVDRRLELFAVADGMGGHRAGEVASATALEGLRQAVDSGSEIGDAVGRANSAVWDKASADTQLAGMGTTLTAAWSDGTTLTVAHVGDSRAYLLRGETLQRVTVDHSLVEELIRDGRLTEEQAAVHPQRSIITRALGIDSSVAVDVYSLVLQPNDRVMICSDGLTSMVRAAGIAEILRRESDPTAAANALVDAANEAGGEDNITVLVLDAVADGRDPLPSSVAAAIGAAPGSSAPAGESPTEVLEPAVVSVVTTNTNLDAVPDTPTTDPDPEAERFAGSLPRDTARFRDPSRRGRTAGRRAGRGIGRVLLFAVPILIIVGVAIGTIGWYAKNSYFVAYKAGHVTVYRGRPGGLLFWDPEVVRTTKLTRADLKAIPARDVAKKKEFSDLASANQYLRRGDESDDHHDHDDDHLHAAGRHQHDGADRGTVSSRLTPLARARRTRELSLGALALLVTAGGYVLLALSKAPTVPPRLWGFLAAIAALFVCAHLAVRRFAPRADPTLLPIAALLLGIGFVTISRLDLNATKHDPAVAPAQSVWIAVGIGAFVLTLFLVRHVRSLARYRYTFLLIGVAALLIPLVPGLGVEINGARLWVRLGGLTFQPGEIAKVLLVIFFAAYLVEKRELLTSGSRRIGRLTLPDPKHLGPLLVPWGVAILIMVQQKDLGSSLLFFAVFVAMLYIATLRSAYLLAGAALFIGAVAIAYQAFSHVQERVSVWVDPWSDAQRTGYQLTQSLFAFGSGGFAGKGIGLGTPNVIPVNRSDFIFAAIGEELGLIGTVAVVAAFLLIVGSAFRIAMQARRPFSQLFAAGLATILGVQTFVIVGGVTRVIPLTGVTLPFVSYGGSSLVANFVILALLLRISDESAEEAEREVANQARLVAIESVHA